jgi:hypothetical protein
VNFSNLQTGRSLIAAVDSSRGVAAMTQPLNGLASPRLKIRLLLRGDRGAQAQVRRTLREFRRETVNK